MISESRVPENGMPGLMSGDWKRSTVSGPQRLQFDAWTAPDLSATAPALDSTQVGNHRPADFTSDPLVPGARTLFQPTSRRGRQDRDETYTRRHNPGSRSDDERQRHCYGSDGSTSQCGPAGALYCF